MMLVWRMLRRRRLVLALLCSLALHASFLWLAGRAQAPAWPKEPLPPVALALLPPPVEPPARVAPDPPAPRRVRRAPVGAKPSGPAMPPRAGERSASAEKPLEVPSFTHLLRRGSPSLALDAPASQPATPTPQEMLDRYIGERIARRNVAQGRVDPYFGRMAEALAKAAEHPPPMAGDDPFAGYMRAWVENLGRYGKTGSPYPEGMQSGLSWQNDLAQGKLSGMTALVEIRQAADGTIVSALVVQGSGSEEFDGFVLAAAGRAVAGLPAPPREGFGIHPQGLRSVWRFDERMHFLKDIKQFGAKDIPYLLAMAPIGFITGTFDEVLGILKLADFREAQYVCNVELVALE